MKENYLELGFAKLDLSRRERTGFDETVFCSGKTKEQLLQIFSAFQKNSCNALGTRCSWEQYEFVRNAMPEVHYDTTSRILSLRNRKTQALAGKIAICCAGTADLPIAEEAATVVEFQGATVEKFFDIGVAGLHRLLSKIEQIRRANVVIAIAGMEGALAGILTGLVQAPVIAVPTSIGYGASLQGIVPLLSMINSCAEGISVVNIDNGFGAVIQACRILKQIAHH